MTRGSVKRRVLKGMAVVLWAIGMGTMFLEDQQTREIQRVGLEQPDSARGFTTPYDYKGHLYFVPHEMSAAARRWEGGLFLSMPMAIICMGLSGDQKKDDFMKQPRRGLFPWQRS